jgi:hypothetical protein
MAKLYAPRQGGARNRSLEHEKATVRQWYNELAAPRVGPVGNVGSSFLFSRRIAPLFGA